MDLLVADLNKRLAERRVAVEFDKKAKEWVAEKGHAPVFGARPLCNATSKRSLHASLSPARSPTVRR